MTLGRVGKELSQIGEKDDIVEMKLESIHTRRINNCAESRK